MTHAEFHRTLRELGLTQRGLADRLAASVSAVNRWGAVNGRTNKETPVPGYAVAYLELLKEHQEALRRLKLFAELK